MKIETKHFWAISTIAVAMFFGAKILTTIWIVLYAVEIAIGVLAKKSDDSSQKRTLNSAQKQQRVSQTDSTNAKPENVLEHQNDMQKQQRLPLVYDPLLTIVDLKPPAENWDDSPMLPANSSATIEVRSNQILETVQEESTTTTEGMPLYLMQTAEGKALNLAPTVEGQVVRATHEFPKHERTVQSDSADQWADAMNLLRKSPTLFHASLRKIPEDNPTPVEGIFKAEAWEDEK